jgi:hypothetical protein
VQELERKFLQRRLPALTAPTTVISTGGWVGKGEEGLREEKEDLTDVI